MGILNLSQYTTVSYSSFSLKKDRMGQNNGLQNHDKYKSTQYHDNLSEHNISFIINSFLGLIWCIMFRLVKILSMIFFCNPFNFFLDPSYTDVSGKYRVFFPVKDE